MNAARFVSRLTRKSRSNFFYAFLLLPRAQREAIFAVYAFCRIVDDAVDEGVDRAAQRRELARWREEIAHVWGAGAPEHPAAQRLQEAVRRFPIPRAALEEIIAGVEMDLDRATYETFQALYPYCYRVASRGRPLQHRHLRLHRSARRGLRHQSGGRAAAHQHPSRRPGGRPHRPRLLAPGGPPALRRGRGGSARGPLQPGFAELMAFEAGRARDYYARAWRGLPEADAGASSRQRSWGAPTSRCSGPSRPAASTSSASASPCPPPPHRHRAGVLGPLAPRHPRSLAPRADHPLTRTGVSTERRWGGLGEERRSLPTRSS